MSDSSYAEEKQNNEIQFFFSCFPGKLIDSKQISNEALLIFHLFLTFYLKRKPK